MSDEWKGEHLIRSQRVFAPVVDAWPKRREAANDRKLGYVEALRQGVRDGLSLTAAAKKAGISVPYASILNKEHGIGFKSKPWITRRQGLIA